MRIPSAPPNFTEVFKNIDLSWINRLSETDTMEFVRRSNDAYFHWDQIRHFHDLPEGTDSEFIWAAISISRRQQYQPLPIKFNDSKLIYWNPPQHLEWLCKIDQQAGGGIGSNSRMNFFDDNERYLFSSLMEEAIASSLLEGAVTTRKKAKQMLLEGRKPHNKAEKMCLNNYNAILKIRELKHARLSSELLKDLQSILTEETLDDLSAVGRFRNEEDDVIVADTRTNEILFTPPPASSIESYIDEICKFANERSKPFIHPVIKAIILHFALGYVHPFVDGNGRTARATFYWYMLKRGYDLFEFLPISRIFLQAPARYARSYLYSETDNGDVTYFIHYNLNVILNAIKSLHNYLREQSLQIDQAAKILKDNPNLNHRQQILIYHFLKNTQAALTIQQHKRTHNISYGTARADLLDLVNTGYLQQVQNKKKLIFYPRSELLTKLGKKSVSSEYSQDLISKEENIPNAIAVTHNRKRKSQIMQPLLFNDNNG